MKLQLHALVIEADRRAECLNEERNRHLFEAKAAQTRQRRPPIVWARRWFGRRLMALGFRVAGPAPAPAGTLAM